jgi:DNA polymerase III subunit gamma/tau
MSYKALYLKYRPQTFEEVAGQSAIVRTLKNALSSGKMAHAYLFAGPRGTGKTTMARLFAKALNCEEGLGHQCNKCSNCLEVSEGSHPDVIEIDAASNNGVDQVRDLIEKVKYAPIKGRYKVYIIDEVHMMSTGAFNALLKTLEEPPENVIFILCTTEPYKVLPTIVSRCQRFDFSKLSDEEMKTKLVEVLKAEKTTYDDDGIRTIISLADGGMRDALSILDQTLAYSGNKLASADVLALYGLASTEEKIALLDVIHQSDVAAIMKKCDGYLAGGIDVRRLVSDLIAILKDLYIYERTKDAALLEELSKEQAEYLAHSYRSQEVTPLIDTLVAAQNDFKNVSDVRSLFELTLLRLAENFETPSEGEKAPAAAVKKEAAPKEETPAPKEEKPIIPAKPEPIKVEAKPEPAPVIHEEPKPAPAVEVKKEEPKPAEDVAETPAPKKEAKAKKSFSAPPDFLFDEEKPEKKEEKVEPPKPTVDTSKILQPAIATTGEAYTIPDEDIVKIMWVADKKYRTEISAHWPEFEALKGDPKLGNLATLLFEGRPWCVCKDAVILNYKFTNLRDKANIKENQEPLEELLEAVIGKRLFVYAIDHSDTNRLTTLFFSLMQVNKLPDKDSVKVKDFLPK